MWPPPAGPIVLGGDSPSCSRLDRSLVAQVGGNSLFAPQSADPIEISARYYRVETERWAADARLAKLVRADETGLLARALVRLGSLLAGRQPSKIVRGVPGTPDPVTWYASAWRPPGGVRRRPARTPPGRGGSVADSPGAYAHSAGPERSSRSGPASSCAPAASVTLSPGISTRAGHLLESEPGYLARHRSPSPQRY